MTRAPTSLRIAAFAAAVSAAAACGASVTDPIAGVPLAQQRNISQTQFGFDWPFTVRNGTLACDDGAVAFRADGTTYALNDAAESRGLPNASPLIRMQTSAPPSHPLSSIRQDERQKIFRRARSCEASTQVASVAPCKAQLMAEYKLSPADLAQIDAEGRERLWPPVSPRPRSLEPVLKTARKLCES